MQCAKCTSSDITKLSLVYESGLSHINTRTSGVGIGIGRGGIGVGVGGGRTRGTQISTTAAKAAPPAKQRYGKRMTFGVILALFGLSMFSARGGIGGGAMFLLVGAALIWSAVTAMRWNSNAWPGLYQAWDSSYLCGRCGYMGAPRGAQQINTANDTMLHQPLDELPSQAQDLTVSAVPAAQTLPEA